MSNQPIPEGSQTPSPKRIKYDDGASSNQPGRSKKNAK